LLLAIFGGDNSDWCNQHCPYCYAGPKKRMIQRWRNNIDDWVAAFERLNRDIYFNLSYGEAFGQDGFYEVMDAVGAHPNWEASIITNLSYPVEKLLSMRVAQDRRVYVHASWHPHGGGDWRNFTRNLLTLQEADIPTIVMYLFWPPQVDEWRRYWCWLDAHNIRTCVRRYVGMHDGKPYPQSYPREVWDFLYAMLQPKTRKYGTDLADPHRNVCNASKDMILVHWDGSVGLCADWPQTCFDRNIFDPDFKLNDRSIHCPTHLCGGDYGLLHMYDPALPNELPPDEPLWHDCFIAQTERITGGGKQGRVNYPNRAGMEEWLLKDASDRDA